MDLVSSITDLEPNDKRLRAGHDIDYDKLDDHQLYDDQLDHYAHSALPASGNINDHEHVDHEHIDNLDDDGRAWVQLLLPDLLRISGRRLHVDGVHSGHAGPTSGCLHDDDHDEQHDDHDLQLQHHDNHHCSSRLLGAVLVAGPTNGERILAVGAGEQQLLPVVPVPSADRRSVLCIHHDKLPADHDHASTAASSVLGRMRLLVDSGRERLEAHA